MFVLKKRANSFLFFSTYSTYYLVQLYFIHFNLLTILYVYIFVFGMFQLVYTLFLLWFDIGILFFNQVPTVLSFKLKFLAFCFYLNFYFFTIYYIFLYILCKIFLTYLVDFMICQMNTCFPFSFS